MEPTEYCLAPDEASGYCNPVAARRSPLAGLTFSLVGPGRVGGSLARWAVAAGAEAIAVAGPPASGAARELAGVLDGAVVPLERLSSAAQDLLLLTVPDEALEPLAASLAERPQAAVVLHTSGSRAAAVLAPLRRGGSEVGAFHPLKLFTAATSDPAEAAGLLFGVEGDPGALALADRLAEAWHARTVPVAPEAWPVHGLITTLVTDGIAALVASGAEMALSAGLPPEILAGYSELARGALRRAASAPDLRAPVEGPAARGDRSALRHALETVAELAPESLPLALAVAGESLRRASQGAPPDPEREALAGELAAFTKGGIS